MQRPRRKRWLILIPVVAAGMWFAWNVAIDAASLKVYQVPSKSMSPTIAPGDRVVVETQSGITPARGEIWVFAMSRGMTGIKRVIGLPGESVEVTGGRVLVDGRPIDEPYLAAPITYTMPEVRLKADQYIVLGDSRDQSNDSHVWGPLEASQFIGRVKFRPWPPSRLGGLR